MPFQLTRLLRRGNGLIRSVQLRKMAGWVHPKFRGGNAKPHELSKYWQQFLYIDGEKLFAFAGCFLIPLGVLFLQYDEFYYNRRKLLVEKYVNTCYEYPVAKREE